MAYAAENLSTAQLALANGLLNPSLHNAQQTVEKSLKAVWASRGMLIRKTHSIADLVEDLASIGAKPDIVEDEAILLDSIYLPSKYPTPSVLPDGMPDADVAQRCVHIAERAYAWAARLIEVE